MEMFAAAAAILGGLTLIAAALVTWRHSARSQTITVWRGEAEAQAAKAERLESALHSLEARVAHLETENTMLRELVTGREALAALTEEVQTAHEDFRQRLGRIETAVIL